MKLYLALILLLTLIFNGCTQRSDSKSDAIDKFVQECYDMGMFSGCVLVAGKGNLLFKNAYGYTDLKSGIRLNTATAFYLASISKQFTTMAIMILKEQKKLSYDDKLKTYFPGFPDYAKKITIRHMMTHTSGLPDHYDIITKSEGITNQDALEVLQSQPKLLFDPGTDYHYSNGAYVLLSLIVEKVSGQSFPMYMKENIFDPLDMNRTLVYDQSKPIIRNRAIGYNPFGQERDYTHFTSGAGGMYTTVEDLFKWDRGLYGTELINIETREEAFTPFKLANDSSIHYGFGWEIREDDKGKTVAHSGGLAGFSTYIERYIEDENSIIYLSNRGVPMPWLLKGIRNILNDQVPKLPRIPIWLKIDQIIDKSGIAEAVRQYKDIFAHQKDAYVLSEPLLNAYGYYLLSEERIPDAIEIFKCNAQSYPESPNVYDSLGDAYEANNQFEQATQNYAKALEIEKNNQGEDVSYYRSNLDHAMERLGSH